MALLGAFAAALLGRARRFRFLQPLAAVLGVLLGWSVLAGLSLKFSGPLSRLPAIALAAVVGQNILGTKPHPKLALALAILLALLSAWWLCGAPYSAISRWQEGLQILAAAAWIFAATWLSRGSDPWRTAATSAALAVTLHAVGAPWSWQLVALVPGAAAIGSLAAGGDVAFALSLGICIASAAASASLAIGRMPHGRFGPVDAACLSVPACLWLAGRIATKFRRPGGLQLAVAGGLAFAMVSLAALSAAALARLR